MNSSIIKNIDKYEIVSILRDYKNKALDASKKELDVLLPQIRSFINSNEILNNEFESRIKLFDEIIIGSEYKNWHNDVIERFKKLGEYSSADSLKYNFLEGLSDSGFIISPISFDSKKDKIKNELFNKRLGCLYYYFNNFSIKELECLLPEALALIHQHKLFGFEDMLLPEAIVSHLEKLFKKTIDFKVINTDFLNPYDEYKEINIMKLATYKVLITLESVILNNEKEIEHIEKGIEQYNIPSKLTQEHIKLLKLRKDLSPNNSYKEISKQMIGKCSEGTIKGMANTINTTFGTNNIDEAVRIFEYRFGEL